MFNVPFNLYFNSDYYYNRFIADNWFPQGPFLVFCLIDGVVESRDFKRDFGLRERFFLSFYSLHKSLRPLRDSLKSGVKSFCLTT